mmetsp:Transcript_24862/g.31286  ORF Transcript_24862/g.31286 Transcript_24862/m.31286 type:complete len:94 (+) Transcript_24862:242-523(+)
MIECDKMRYYERILILQCNKKYQGPNFNCQLPTTGGCSLDYEMSIQQSSNECTTKYTIVPYQPLFSRAQEICVVLVRNAKTEYFIVKILSLPQ